PRVLAYYRDHIVPDQARAYRTLASRYPAGQDGAGNGDLVVAQHALAASVATYLQTLAEAWFAVVDIGKLLQAGDLFRIGIESCPTQLACLSGLPSCQIASPALTWPEAEASRTAPSAPPGPRFISGLAPT